MSNTYLVIDVSCLAYRSFYALPDLTHEGVQSAVGFGVFRTVLDLQERFNTEHVVWCFDGGYAKRQEIDPKYKQNRQIEGDSEKKRLKDALKTQISKLRKWTLPAIGYSNVFWRDGYEADDVIAQVCQNLPDGDDAVIVSSDDDMYQLLSENRVCMWLPHRKMVYTAHKFKSEWRIPPEEWWLVKAIAGCPGDNVIGVRGVGPKTAIKFLRRDLKPDSKAHRDIWTNERVWRDNKWLVMLPFEGIGDFSLCDDGTLTMQSWNEVMNAMGMESMVKGR